SRSVIQMNHDFGVFEEVTGVWFQVFWKLPNTNQFVPKPNVRGGTGCLIGSRKGQPFILTSRLRYPQTAMSFFPMNPMNPMIRRRCDLMNSLEGTLGYTI